MPPAFNLSQDQTLQFDLHCKVPTHLTLAIPHPLTRRGTAYGRQPKSPTALASCEHSSLRNPPPSTPRRALRRRKPADARSLRSSTHTYRLPIVKEQAAD